MLSGSFSDDFPDLHGFSSSFTRALNALLFNPLTLSILDIFISE